HRGQGVAGAADRGAPGPHGRDDRGGGAPRARILRACRGAAGPGRTAAAPPVPPAARGPGERIARRGAMKGAAQPPRARPDVDRTREGVTTAGDTPPRPRCIARLGGRIPRDSWRSAVSDTWGARGESISDSWGRVGPAGPGAGIQVVMPTE